VEAAKARLLPENSSMEWLSALHRFEQSPAPESGAGADRPSVVAQAAKPAVLKRSARVAFDSDNLSLTPSGFTRYEKVLCNSWECVGASLALPGQVDILDDSPLRSVYLAKKDGISVSVVLGPALERYPGPDRRRRNSRSTRKYYLANYVWLAVKAGIGSSSSSATVDGYPALVTDFRATQRDLADMHAWLGLIRLRGENRCR